ncbi:ABC transporter permease [Caballeronia mineralivorans]|uniref:ABC transporter permease n=1 Tax=Caballeronia mineralivorans TaxID=2010198 RepID=UPI002AFE8B98|nr:FtsX-like permease family protein [Caballeronia mineralivorans]
MKYFPLIWATLWRKKARTIFTLLSVIAAFLLFGVLETVDYAFSHASGGITGADKLITTNKYSIVLSLPFSDTQQIRSVPGVAEVTWMTWFGAYYQESKNFVFALPIDAETYFNLHNGEFIVSDAQMQAYRNTRTGALVNVALMKKFGWKVGDKLPLHSTIWTQKDDSLDWTFDIVGSFDAKDPTQASQQASSIWFHYEYFDEGRSFGKGTVGWFEERISDPSQSLNVANRIDALFANSSNETRTQPANDFAMTFMKQIGDIGFVLRAILSAVFFALLFLTGNTMMQSVRERIPELAVLKTVGFGDGKVLTLVLAEALLLCLIAAVIGLALSYAALPVIKQGLQGVELSPIALIPGIGAAALLALIVGLPPALRAMRLNIVDALAKKR